MGLERLLLLMETNGKPSQLIAPALTAYIMAVDEPARILALALAEKIRNAMPSWSILVDTNGGRFKAQFKKADKQGARLALILGEEELLDHTISIKDLRGNQAQQSVPEADIVAVMKNYLIDKVDKRSV